MGMEHFKGFLFWCVVIDYFILMAWFLAFALAGDWLFKLHGRWFTMSRPMFDAVHYAGMAIYKIGILLFFLVPLLTLCATS